MKTFHFEVEERSIYRFTIDATCRDRAIKLFQESASEYMSDDNLDNIHLDYDVTE